MTDGATLDASSWKGPDSPMIRLYQGWSLIGVVNTMTAWVVGQSGTILLTRDGEVIGTKQESFTTTNLGCGPDHPQNNRWGTNWVVQMNSGVPTHGPHVNGV